ncbi:MAG: Holliday junction resolvase RuvX [Rickettsiales bacterium]|nr:Holliday junction resolvase RuvX [Rickettsiales bacterium]
MGLDIGLKRIGLSLSDRDWNIATPRTVLRRKNLGRDLEAIADEILENRVCALVCGQPLTREGESTKFSMFIENFVIRLEEFLHIPILLVDEHLTSFMAEEFLREDMSESYLKSKKILDKVAAAYILQSVLEKLEKQKK